MRTQPTRALLFLLAVVIGGLAFLAFWWSRAPRSPVSDPAGPRKLNEALKAAHPAVLPGEEILRAYGRPETRPEEDLAMMAHAFRNLALLVKGPDPWRLGANEEFAAALLGKNKARLRFLPDAHPCLNAAGQLVDRWQTPLYFHASAHDQVEIRSAGPDQQMWTQDDLHRRHNGQFLRGPDLTAKSLYPPPAPPQQTGRK